MDRIDDLASLYATAAFMLLIAVALAVVHHHQRRVDPTATNAVTVRVVPLQ